MKSNACVVPTSTKGLENEEEYSKLQPQTLELEKGRQRKQNVWQVLLKNRCEIWLYLQAQSARIF